MIRNPISEAIGPETSETEAQAKRKRLEDAICKFNAGDIDGYVETMYAEDAVFHYFPPGLPQGWAGAKLFYTGFLEAFPDARLTIADTVVEEGKMAARFQMEMTHLGKFQGIPATGKRVTLTGATFMRFAGEKVAERWNEADFLGLMQQLGLAPQPT